ncbi:hypothetical protein ECARS42123_5187 [Escherichia coli ARS4.2123]|nr:hypothetical protein ECARS42123_5187 [Escherichia coli ARS4.2123]
MPGLFGVAPGLEFNEQSVIDRITLLVVKIQSGLIWHT